MPDPRASGRRGGLAPSNPPSFLEPPSRDGTRDRLREAKDSAADHALALRVQPGKLQAPAVRQSDPVRLPGGARDREREAQEAREGAVKTPLKLACVVHRFGADIAGGSEGHCHGVAARLAEHHDVTILTTC